MKKVFLGIIIILLGIGETFAQNEINFSDKSWEKVLAKAEKSNKLIFVDAYTDWCNPCKYNAAASLRCFATSLGDLFLGIFLHSYELELHQILVLQY